MKCNNCGYENQQNFDYCPNCGTATQPSEPIQTAEAVSLNPAADKIMCALKDNMFLILCVLITVSCGLSLLSGTLPLIQVLITIFLWLTYADAQKGFANEKHLRFVSGTVYAGYVITNVVCGILIVCGVLFCLLFGVLFSQSEIIDMLTLSLAEYEFISLADLPIEILSIVGWIFGIAFVLIAAIGLVINILGMKKIHRLAKSVYMGVMFQNPNFENTRAAKNWLLFFGICSAISAIMSLGSITMAFATGCSAAVEIIASVLIDKHIVSKAYYVA